jgi:hydrogenase-1 operon protein HyaF
MDQQSEVPAAMLLRDRADAPAALAGTHGLRRPSSRRLGASGPAALAFLQGLIAGLRGTAPRGRVPLSPLPPSDAAAILALLGEGEVRLRLGAGGAEAVETVMPGLWLLHRPPPPCLELGEVPQAARDLAALLRPLRGDAAEARACPLLAEVADLADGWSPGQENHILPLPVLAAAEREALDHALGEGPVRGTVLGYGAVDVTAAAWRHVWRVRHLDARGGVMLDTVEVGDVPGALRAAPQDLADSAERLEELVEAFAR